MGTGSTRVLIGAAVTALVLSGCGLLGGDEREPGRGGDPEWVLDEDSERYYRPDLVVHSTELIEEHFPVLEVPTSATIAEGRFTDPSERVPIPAPDDYWWQSVTVLDLGQADTLMARALPGGASDLGGSAGPESLPDREVRTMMVGPLEPGIEDCDGDWIDVTPALTEPGYTGRSAAGDIIELAVVCESGTQLITSAHDM